MAKSIIESHFVHQRHIKQTKLFTDNNINKHPQNNTRYLEDVEFQWSVFPIYFRYLTILPLSWPWHCCSSSVKNHPKNICSELSKHSPNLWRYDYHTLNLKINCSESNLIFEFSSSTKGFGWHPSTSTNDRATPEIVQRRQQSMRRAHRSNLTKSSLSPPIMTYPGHTLKPHQRSL